MIPLTLQFKEIGIDDIPKVGGKNASLGEMIRNISKLGIHVPQGFALTTQSYWLFIERNKLKDPIQKRLNKLENGDLTLEQTGKKIRKLILSGQMPEEIINEVRQAYSDLCHSAKKEKINVAVRSSATAEDLPDASFAGQHESYLNVKGFNNLIGACQKCLASLFTDRAITYRTLNKIDHMKVALSVGVQMMVKASSSCSGVMFSIDTETGFPDVVVINGAWGLGEGIVSGAVDPDEYIVYKPFLSDRKLAPILQKKIGSKLTKIVYNEKRKDGTKSVYTRGKDRKSFVLNDKEILTLSNAANHIEAHYKVPMDMEWAKDADNGRLYLLQARPETVQARKKQGEIWSYKLKKKSDVLVQGVSIGEAIASGRVCLLTDISKADKFPEGAVLVAPKTDPDWLPVMKKASALITDHGGRTSHAAIVSRELGLPAVIGTGNACKTLKNNQDVTVSCAEGDHGFVYAGTLPFEKELITYEGLPKTKTKLMLNIANPYEALRWWRMPADGIGLARIEFIISNNIKIHPMALINIDKVKSKEARKQILELTANYTTKEDYFVENLARDISLIAASQYPKPVIVRFSDFKTNEYSNLIGGATFEPVEDNPMIGWRGASRYYDENYRDAFALECQAIKYVREKIGFKNVIVMVPFCRTLGEADAVLKEMKKQRLIPGQNGLQVYVMAEIPANIILAEEFADRFDGFSIGSNDLTQLTLGIDRDSHKLSSIFNAADPAVVSSIRDLIKRAHRKKAKVGLCGQAPSDNPEYARILVDAGIDSLSVTPDSFISVKKIISKAEAG
ncbi:MAG: phosphoenolpyruvate synthase [Alphaproteobacteria bacterium]|nr:phosphoenolpyruvate synthase [Alphaproteobacteria bacterium]HPF46077.1 phosphoenolpyruvate synthase [Emcibacteraceae bacterium]